MHLRKTAFLSAVTACLALALLGCTRDVPSEKSDDVKPGLRTVNGVRVLTLVGTPEQMGRQHGELLGEDIRWVLKEIIGKRNLWDKDDHKRFLERIGVMEKFLDDSWRRELRALAKAARVDYTELVGLQLFGDVERAAYCSSFAVFGRSTRTGECIIGRNFDYFYEDVAKRASIIIDYHPTGGAHRFITVTWAGVINGWTLMNDAHVVTANNTAYSFGRDSLEGVSTCFMLRKIAERANSVEAGINIVKSTPRACATNLIIAGGKSPDAAVVEYDHERILIRRAKEDYILATNQFVELDGVQVAEPTFGRYAVLLKLIRDNYGKIDRSMNFAAAEGVPIASINLHSVMLYPKDLTFAVAMGEVPAFRGRWRRFRMGSGGIVSAE